MKVSELEKEYGEVRLPKAFRFAVSKSKEAEILVYSVLANCLEHCEDVAVSLDRSDVVCNFLRNWKREGHLTSNALRYEETEETASLSCVFDIYKIRDDLEFINDFFGTINFAAIESSLDSCNIDISYERYSEIVGGIQKAKRPQEVYTGGKKDN